MAEKAPSKPTQTKASVSRTAEFVLGLLGGIFGLFAAVFAMVIGGAAEGLQEAGYDTTGGDTVIGLGWLALVLSVVAIVAASLVKSRTQISGWLLLVSGVGGFVAVSLFWLIPGVLIILSGLMALLRGRSA